MNRRLHRELSTGGYVRQDRIDMVRVGLPRQWKRTWETSYFSSRSRGGCVGPRMWWGRTSRRNRSPYTRVDDRERETEWSPRKYWQERLLKKNTWERINGVSTFCPPMRWNRSTNRTYLLEYIQTDGMTHLSDCTRVLSNVNIRFYVTKSVLFEFLHFRKGYISSKKREVLT